MPELPLRSPFGPAFSPADASALTAASNRTRLQILHLLHIYGPLSVLDLQRHTGLSQGTTSHHLHVLESARLIEAADGEGHGSFRPRQLRPGALGNVHQALAIGRRR